MNTPNNIVTDDLVNSVADKLLEYMRETPPNEFDFEGSVRKAVRYALDSIYSVEA